MPIRIVLRHGTAAEWTAANPVLALGEPGVESDTKKFKIGDGTTAWSSLTYSANGSGGSTVSVDANGTITVDGTSVSLATDAEVASALANKVNTSTLGVASGVATLGADGVLSPAQRPDYTGTYARVDGATYTGTHDFTGATVTGVAGGSSGTATGVPTVINVKDATYGAKGDGTTDDNTAIQAAVTAALAAGGPCVIYFPPGIYLCSGMINLNNSTQVTIRGAGGRADRAPATTGGPGTPRTELRYTGTGLRFISAALAVGFTIDNIAIRYSSTSFTGDLVAVTGLKRVPAYGFTMRDSLVGGYNGAKNAHSCVLLDGIVEALIENSAICDATYGLIGRNDAAVSATVWAASAAYSVGALVAPTTGNDLGHYFKATVAGTSGATEPTWPTVVGQTVTDGTVTWVCMGARPNTFATAVTIVGGRFGKAVTNAILAPDEQWALYDVVFEPSSGGAPCGIQSGTIGFKGLVLSGCAFWDSANAGTWLDITGQGLTMVGCLVSSSGASSTVLGPTHGWLVGVAIHGGYYTGSGKLIDPGSQHIEQLSIRGCYLSTSMASSVTALTGNANVTASTTYG